MSSLQVNAGKRKQLNHYEARGNLALALETMERDGVRLVNIGEPQLPNDSACRRHLTFLVLVACALGIRRNTLCARARQRVFLGMQAGYSQVRLVGF